MQHTAWYTAQGSTPQFYPKRIHRWRQIKARVSKIAKQNKLCNAVHKRSGGEPPTVQLLQHTQTLNGHLSHLQVQQPKPLLCQQAVSLTRQCRNLSVIKQQTFWTVNAQWATSVTQISQQQTWKFKEHQVQELIKKYSPIFLRIN